MHKRSDTLGFRVKDPELVRIRRVRISISVMVYLYTHMLCWDGLHW